MKSSTGRWVSGDDFFDREDELEFLGSRVRDGNHVVMTGQRRMGKTSILQELGRRLELEGWVFLFADVEADRSDPRCPRPRRLSRTAFRRPPIPDEVAEPAFGTTTDP